MGLGIKGKGRVSGKGKGRVSGKGKGRVSGKGKVCKGRATDRSVRCSLLIMDIRMGRGRGRVKGRISAVAMVQQVSTKSLAQTPPVPPVMFMSLGVVMRGVSWGVLNLLFNPCFFPFFPAGFGCLHG